MILFLLESCGSTPLLFCTCTTNDAPSKAPRLCAYTSMKVQLYAASPMTSTKNKKKNRVVVAIKGKLKVCKLVKV